MQDLDAESLVRRLRILEAKEALREMLARYGAAADRRNDPVLLAELYTDDIVWEAEGFGRYSGKQEVIRYVSELARDSIVWTMHYMVSPSFTLDSDASRADCRWNLFEMAMIRTGGEPVAHWIAADYRAQAVRGEDGNWRLSHVELRPKLISPYKEGWDILPSALYNG